MYRIAFLFLSILLFSNSAFAALELELTQGVSSAIPLGFSSLGSEDALSPVIQSDLKNSGRFQIKGDLGFIHEEPAYWKSLGADYFLKGQIHSLGGGAYQVQIMLSSSLGTGSTLINQNFTVNHQDLRQLAHHISDLVYEALTGDKGIFSTRIAYISVNREIKPFKYRLEIADADGFNPRVLLSSSHPIMSPNWSADARQLAYVSFENKKAEIFKVDVASGQRRLLSSFEGINGAPAWSPDGQKMAIVLSKSGSPKIYLLDLSSLALRQLTNGISIDTEPSFAPDGKGLLFTSNRGGSPQIYRYDLNSGQIVRITFDGNYNSRASYSPDGRFLVMQHRNAGQYNIAVMESGFSSVRTLTNGYQDESPSLSPNGKMILYATHLGQNGVLSLVSIDGRVHMRLPSSSGDVQEPSWSPFKR